MIKIIFTDVDGTLLDSWGNVSQDNINACMKAQQENIPVVVNTGRYGTNALKVAKIIKADQHHGYSIGNDGAEIWSFKDNKWIYLSQLNHEVASKLAEWLLNYHPDLLLNFGALNHMYVNRLYSKWGKWLEHLDISIKQITTFNDIEENVSKVLVILEQYWDSNKIKQFITDFETKFPDLTIVQYHTNVFSIGNKDISKGTAISWLCQHLKIDVQDALAIGDSFNDLTMFEVVGHPVVMDNAHEAIKSYGEWIAPNNDNHGVCRAIEHYISKS
ncbi:Cof-type HAD-IIB family hydrolase [Spiroplasma platyhelix]|uniref:Cof-type HAD-IIB family hydrolase n=1 Tax=Spiroplasma platyhelix PALS-1 TaxID=1276218 RepID=A0A846TVN2_9MOLU|nr:Cof-type HAD-IIB family hydrolase [Spiroplasma platyhelix]MBE4703829.1 Phosphatase YwpJ [Spiroplasma platyhelix PALS-1]NKE38202.1 Cof-type HAD-IIB family hydrolase [Spiroplasma platyhelix PALS-1]UJB29087.1 HAD superfamily hydrolase [Spiroplasma platyhelix PALS-1]